MADTLVERITGQARAGDMQAEVAIVVMPVEALTGPANSGTGSVRGAESGAPDGGGVRAGSGGVTSGVVAEVLGYGPIRSRWPGDPRRLPRAALVAAAVHRPARRRHRRRPQPPLLRRHSGHPDRLP